AARRWDGPVGTARRKMRRVDASLDGCELRRRSEDDTVFEGIDLENIETLGGGDAESASLSDREPEVSAMLPDVPAGGVFQTARPGRQLLAERLRVARDEIGGPRPFGNETDLLTLGLVGGRQIRASRAPAHFFLRQVSHGKPRGFELRRSQVVEKIGLILRRVSPLLEEPAPGNRVCLAAHVVARRDGLASHRSSAL